MSLGTGILVITLLALAHSQEDVDNTCTCSSVIVMSKAELAQEIRSQVAVALSQGSIKPTTLPCTSDTNNVTSTVERTMDELFEKVERLVKPITTKLAFLQQPGKSPSHPASSCKEILDFESKSPSGLYWLRASNGSAVKMFCDMTRTCGGVIGGWMKLTKLDMTNATNQCPEPLSIRTHNGKRLCARRSNNGGRSSVYYKTHGVGYNEVCGRVIGYQHSSVDGIIGGLIDGNYIDGVSLTHGSPRHHIWTFVAALDEAASNIGSTCHCINRNHRGPLPPSFVGNDYFCDTGSAHSFQYNTFYSDPLWDGAGCGPLNECCTFQNPPWFYKNLTSGTGDDIEMRVCRSEDVSNEDVLLEKVDIYVR